MKYTCLAPQRGAIFVETFWHLKNAEPHVGRFLVHPNVLEAVSKGFRANSQTNNLSQRHRDHRGHKTKRCALGVFVRKIWSCLGISFL